MKKVLSMTGIVVSLILITSIPSVVSEHENISVSRNLIAFGYIRINPHKYVINGFVLAGINGNQVLSFEFIHIDHDRTPISVTKSLPFVWFITYQPYG